MIVHIAASYNLTEAVDSIVITLLKYATQIATAVTPTNETSPTTLFGQNKKALLAMKVAFSVTKKYASWVREAWKTVIPFILLLNKLSLLPTFLEKYELNDPSNSAKAPKKETKSGASLWNIGSSWFGLSPTTPSKTDEVDTTEDTTYDIMEKDPQAEKNAQEAVKGIDIPEILTISSTIHSDSLKALILAVLANCGKADMFKNTPSKEERKNALFSMDLLTSIALANSQRITEIWTPISDHLSSVIETSSKMNEYTEKSIVNLLIIAIRLSQSNALDVTVIMTSNLSSR